MVTIRDIAKKTGYSISTVSHALNDRPRVSEKTRAEILQVARELNYIPNSKAISLSTGKSNTIGIIIPYTKKNSYYDSIISSIISECFLNGYRPTFLPTNYDKGKELDYLRLFASKEFDGLIFTSAANEYKVIESYLEYGPIVSCEDTGESNVPFVILERASAFSPIIEKLQKKGLKKMACTFSRMPFSSLGATETYQVFEHTIENFSLDYTFSNCRTYHDGMQAASYFYSFDPAIEVIFANSDEIAAGMIGFYTKHSINPKPTIIGRDNDSWSKALNFPSIDFHLDSLGSTVVQLCLKGDYQRIYIPSDYVERA